MNFSMIIYVLGWVLKLEAGIMILPIICAQMTKPSRA